MPSPKNDDRSASYELRQLAELNARPVRRPARSLSPGRPQGFRAGIDAENPLLVITHVQA